MLPTMFFCISYTDTSLWLCLLTWSFVITLNCFPCLFSPTFNTPFIYFFHFSFHLPFLLFHSSFSISSFPSFFLFPNFLFPFSFFLHNFLSPFLLFFPFLSFFLIFNIPPLGSSRVYDYASLLVMYDPENIIFLPFLGKHFFDYWDFLSLSRYTWDNSTEHDIALLIQVFWKQKQKRQLLQNPRH